MRKRMEDGLSNFCGSGTAQYFFLVGPVLQTVPTFWRQMHSWGVHHIAESNYVPLSKLCLHRLHKWIKNEKSKIKVLTCLPSNYPVKVYNRPLLSVSPQKAYLPWISSLLPHSDENCIKTGKQVLHLHSIFHRIIEWFGLAGALKIV